MPRRQFLKNTFIPVAIFVLVVISFVFAVGVFAQVDVGLEYATATGLETRDIRVIAANIIRVFLGLLGIIAISLILYGGFIWMTAAGDAEKINKAKKILINAGIGLAIVLSAYAITSFVINKFLLGGAGRVGGPPSPPAIRAGGGALGGGIVDYHYPPRNGRDISRSTKISVTFKEKMLPNSLIDNTNNSKNADNQPIYGDCVDGNNNGAIDWGECDQLQPENIKIRKSVADPKKGPFVTEVTALTRDNQTFVFTPKEYLGSVSENVSYNILLGGELKKANGDKAFGSLDTYNWDFEVSTNVDSTPPQIESVIPTRPSEDRNVIIQVNFNEAIDPTAVIGNNAASFNLVVQNTKDNSYPVGKFMISNQYRTVEFLTEDWCGRNSCGGDVYCLPASADIKVLVKAATLAAAPPQAQFPYDGVVDMSGNSLDGNKNKTADGPGDPPAKDNHQWTFKTTNSVDLEAPVVEAMEPAAADIPRDALLKARFNKELWMNTVNTTSIKLEGIPYSIGAVTKDNKTTVIIYHDLFAEDTEYIPRLTSNIQDYHQNCYNPCKGPGCVGERWLGHPSCGP